MSNSHCIASTPSRDSCADSLLMTASGALAADWKSGSTDWSQLPVAKQSKLGLYLSPQQALDMKRANPTEVAFYDIRTPAEANYLGMPTDIDALVPFAENQWGEWDDTRHFYKMQFCADFAAELQRRLTSMGLNTSAPIILICRSGDRSARAADLLNQQGYAQVYSVAEGYEGDMAKDGPATGQRAVNGWKNAGLPWSYTLDKAKAYFPAMAHTPQ